MSWASWWHCFVVALSRVEKAVVLPCRWLRLEWLGVLLCAMVGFHAVWEPRREDAVDYNGPCVEHAKELSSVVHGGQVVLTQHAWIAVQDHIPGQAQVWIPPRPMSPPDELLA